MSRCRWPKFLALALLAVLWGGARDARALEVALIGDNSKAAADLALLVVDAAQGPLPIVREHILVARQANVPLLAIFFARTRELRTAMPDDHGDFLNLEEMVVREMLDTYKMGADSSPVFFDSAAGDLRRFLASKLSTRVPASNFSRQRHSTGCLDCRFIASSGSSDQGQARAR